MILEIITPDKNVYKGEVTSVSLPGIDGRFGVLDNHAPIISALQTGEINVVDNEANNHSFTIEGGGVVEVLKNEVIILTESI